MTEQASRLARIALAVILSFAITTQAVAAKCVSLDFQNPNRKLDKSLKPYHKKMRERIEAEWLLSHFFEDLFFCIRPVCY